MKQGTMLIMLMIAFVLGIIGFDIPAFAVLSVAAILSTIFWMMNDMVGFVRKSRKARRELPRCKEAGPLGLVCDQPHEHTTAHAVCLENGERLCWKLIP